VKHREERRVRGRSLILSRSRGLEQGRQPWRAATAAVATARGRRWPGNFPENPLARLISSQKGPWPLFSSVFKIQNAYSKLFGAQINFEKLEKHFIIFLWYLVQLFHLGSFSIWAIFHFLKFEGRSWQNLIFIISCDKFDSNKFCLLQKYSKHY
jgi:hypothetical protein